MGHPAIIPEFAGIILVTALKRASICETDTLTFITFQYVSSCFTYITTHAYLSTTFVCSRPPRGEDHGSLSYPFACRSMAWLRDRLEALRDV